MENLKPGDPCEECLSQGLNHTLRYFYINLEEQLLKCESRSCLWPHNDEASTDEEELVEPIRASPKSALQPTSEDDDDFIMELLQQLAPNHEPSTESSETITICSMPDLSVTSGESKVPSPALSSQSGNANLFSLPNLCDDVLSKPQHSEQNLFSSPRSYVYQTPPKTEATTTTTTLMSNWLITESPGKSATSCEPEIWLKPNPVHQLPTPKSAETSDTPKAVPFQAPLIKASTLTRTQQLSKASPPRPAKPAPPPTTAKLSTFLDALKRLPETTKPARGTKQPRRVITSAAAGGLSGGQLGTQLVRQVLERIEANRDKEAKPEAENELAKEAEKEAKH